MCAPHRVTPTPCGAHSLFIIIVCKPPHNFPLPSRTTTQGLPTWLSERIESPPIHRKSSAFFAKTRGVLSNSCGVYIHLLTTENQGLPMFLHKRVILRFAAYDISNLNRRIVGEEQGIIYRVHLLFPNVKYLKFSLRGRYSKSCVLLSNQSIFSFQAPTKKIVNEDFHGTYFTFRTSRWASIKGTRKTNEKRERLFCKNTLFIAHEAVTLQ